MKKGPNLIDEVKESTKKVQDTVSEFIVQIYMTSFSF